MNVVFCNASSVFITLHLADIYASLLNVNNHTHARTYYTSKVNPPPLENAGYGPVVSSLTSTAKTTYTKEPTIATEKHIIIGTNKLYNFGSILDVDLLRNTRKTY